MHSQNLAPAELHIHVNEENAEQPDMEFEMEKMNLKDAIWIRGDLRRKNKTISKPKLQFVQKYFSIRTF
ncbi:hypothetical protein JTB14_021264 [Gonioctena quinquepunctata]|nr:hypothetical protein JTB14_021264 [Gonioctena quinquepunctata]